METPMETPFERHFTLTRKPAPIRRARTPRGLVTGVIIAAVLTWLVDPASAAKPKRGFEPAVAPPVPALPTAPTAGSIFNVNTGYIGFVEGRRAHAVGDTLRVMLVENMTTAKTARAQTQKQGQFNVVPPTAGPLSFLNPNALNASGGSSFNGQGNATQTSLLTGEVGVTIVEVRANGTAFVRGEKRMVLSQGQEWVQFSGIVRLGDVDQENRVMSTQVADARVEYTGNGSIGRASREGWLSRFFNAISPF
ncbi:MAG: flagellar biosynthesis protein FlgH [Novosphingobium sp. 28-62-57]|nr:MAG: flagellar biosynthesis protein FlgH [Novosphingobium sp. 12-63-9]OYZ08804.1 MAG: flagellar biosynthesis protein FlgH [Novosphingobium sp. 28-62-57]OZA37659.1 MAG: flagellar biosynthesis protein FlgH [Novosphingobium sp. 17-62-9]